jgi:hypothetical protein
VTVERIGEGRGLRNWCEGFGLGERVAGRAQVSAGEGREGRRQAGRVVRGRIMREGVCAVPVPVCSDL